MNKVTQSIYQKKVDELEENVNILKNKKLYRHTLKIKTANYTVYMTIYNNYSTEFDVIGLKSFVRDKGFAEVQAGGAYTSYDYPISGCNYYGGIVTFNTLRITTLQENLEVTGLTTAPGAPTVSQDITSVTDQVKEA